jgi:hypothetical protein
MAGKLAADGRNKIKSSFYLKKEVSYQVNNLKYLSISASSSIIVISTINKPLIP